MTMNCQRTKNSFRYQKIDSMYWLRLARLPVVGPAGLEPATPALSTRCSNQLSYGPGSAAKRSERWWSQTDSNRRHSACKADALPTELWPRMEFPPGGRDAICATSCRGFPDKPVKERSASIFKNLLYVIERNYHQVSQLRKNCLAVNRPRFRGCLDRRNCLSTSPKLLLRKEVIQPQVPLRLPCYDFIPITSPTLGRCLRS